MENTIPKSFYEMKKLIGALGLKYEKIHACPKGCMLFWKDKAKEDICSHCGLSRWKLAPTNDDDDPQYSSRRRKKIAAKILRWFSLIPRLERLFHNSETVSLMRWHEEGRTKDGLLRHPADSEAWKKLNSLDLGFSSDP